MIRQGIATQAVILSTCHRIEVYAVGAASAHPGRLGQFLCDERGLSWANVQPYAGSLVGGEAAIHLFRVTAGLDSMVMGEREILGQVKAAFAAAKGADTVGPQLDGLFRWAIHVARRVHHETALGTVPRSLGRWAVEVGSTHLGGLSGRTVFILGAGQVARAVAEHAHAEGATVVVCSRTAVRARRLAGQRGPVLPLEQLGRGLEGADFLVCCAAAPNPLVHGDLLRRVVMGRNGRPLVVLDLSVPRVVEVEAQHIPGIELLDLESLAPEGVGDDPALRVAIRNGQAIANEEARAYAAWTAGRQAGAVIAALRQRVEDICGLELERRLRSQRSLSRTEAREVLRRALAKLLHAPTVAAREAVASGDSQLLSSVSRIFGFELDADSFPSSSSPPF